MRWLLVEAGLGHLLRSKARDRGAAHVGADGIAARRGKRIAAVAFARRLAGILYAMWRDGQDYRAARPREGGIAIT